MKNSHPTYCSPLTNLKEVAQIMVENNSSTITVVENLIDLKPIGIVTSLDVLAIMARGLNPSEIRAGECMSENLDEKSQ